MVISSLSLFLKKNLLGEKMSFTCDAWVLKVKQPNILVVSDMPTQTSATKTAGKNRKGAQCSHPVVEDR